LERCIVEVARLRRYLDETELTAETVQLAVARIHARALLDCLCRYRARMFE